LLLQICIGDKATLDCSCLLHRKGHLDGRIVCESLADTIGVVESSRLDNALHDDARRLRIERSVMLDVDRVKESIGVM